VKNTKDFTRFEKLLSFLQGASWALAIAGGTYFFLLFLPFGWIVACVIGLFCFLFGALFVVVFEVASLQIAKFSEAQKQTALLQRWIDTNDAQTLSDH